MPYKIQRLGLGGVLDQAIAITKDHFGLLFAIMLYLLIPFSLIMQFVIFSLEPELPADPTLEDIIRFQREAGPSRIAAGLFGLANGLVIWPVTNAAVIQAVARLYLGLPVTAGEALRHGLSRAVPLVGTTILMMLTIFGGLILFIIPGIYFAIWYGLSQHVVVLEELSGSAALKRSKQLVHPQRGTFLALGIVLFAINFGVTMAATLIPQVYAQIVAHTLLTSVTTILWTAAAVVFYFSCRCVVDNFDLHHLAESIGEDAPIADADRPLGSGAF